PVITQGGKPVTVLPGEIAMLALITPPITQVNAVPAMMPLAAALPSETSGGGGAAAVTITVAVPETEPLLALTVLLKVPAAAPAVKRPVFASIVPPPLATDQTGEIAKTLPLASLPIAPNCCVPLGSRTAGLGVTVTVTSAADGAV